MKKFVKRLLLIVTAITSLIGISRMIAYRTLNVFGAAPDSLSEGKEPPIKTSPGNSKRQIRRRRSAVT